MYRNIDMLACRKANVMHETAMACENGCFPFNYQSFPINGFMTLQWGDFPPQISLGKEKERDKTGGLGGHWVKASNFSGAPDGPTRSGIRFVFAVYK